MHKDCLFTERHHIGWYIYDICYKSPSWGPNILPNTLKILLPFPVAFENH